MVLSKTEFANQFLSRLTNNPQDYVHNADHYSFQSKNGGMEFILTNLYTNYVKTPDQKDSIIDNFITKINQQMSREQIFEDFDSVKSLIIPRVRSKDYIEDYSKWIGNHKDISNHKIITTELQQHTLPFLKVSYVISKDMIHTLITDNLLLLWNISESDLFEIAMTNLQRIHISKPIVWKRETTGILKSTSTQDISLATRFLMLENIEEIIRRFDLNVSKFSIIATISMDTNLIITTSDNHVGACLMGDIASGDCNLRPKDSITNIPLRYIRSLRLWTCYIPRENETIVPLSEKEADFIISCLQTSKPPPRRKPPCSYCFTDLSKAQRCSKCLSVYYCGVECQRKHWNIHKMFCKK
jgi:hypothetical protein